jgi:hypothetical protein
MVTEMRKNKKRRRTHQISVEFSDEKVTSFGGLVMAEELGRHLGLWRVLAERLPERAGAYSWLDVIKAGVGGLLTGSRGTFATEDLRDDEALLDILGLRGAPEEATFWRCLEGLGEMVESGELRQVQREWTRRVLRAMPRRDLLECDGFFPVFADGSFLEGSRRREGTKLLRDREPGLMWATIFAGPLVAEQAIAKPGEGEESLIRAMLPEVVDNVLAPLKLKSRALLLADALHGDGPTLDAVEAQALRYVVGAGGLSETQRVLHEQPDVAWHDLGPNPKRGWLSSSVCVCWVQCKSWPTKRVLVGRRVVHENEMFDSYYGVMTNLTEADLGCASGAEFAQRVWRLYDAKGRMELGYQELLSDLGLHHPPCQAHVRNAGFYALATLAHTLGAGSKLIGSRGDKDNRRARVKDRRDGVPERTHVRPRRGMRLWRVRRRLFAIPARVSWHARRLRVVLLGVSPERQAQFERWRLCISRC